MTNSARSAGSIGSSHIGFAPPSTMHRAAGGRPGPERAAGSCSIKARTNLTYGNGFSACQARSARFASLAATMTSRSRTTLPPISNTKMALQES